VSLKTKNAERPVEVPPVLRSCLLKLCAGKQPDEYIFGTLTDGTLLVYVKELCERAGVPVVTTYGLRGTHNSCTMQVSKLVEAASKGAGHGSVAVTRSHYIAAGVEQSARAGLMEELLFADLQHEAEEIAARDAREAAKAAETLARLQKPTAGNTPAGDNNEKAVPNDQKRHLKAV
jgi:hypothetical protein